MSSRDNEYSAQESNEETYGQGGDVQDDSYVNRQGQSSEVPVVKDDAPIASGNDNIDPDSDQMLARDDAEAIDQNNIVEGRTRGAKPAGGYKEPGDEEGLPADDGTSSV